MLTSSRSRGSVRSSLSNTMVTSARLRAGRVAVPANTTSSIFGVRRLLADWVPMTQDTASTRFDLPEPLGPTITVTPGRNSRRVRSANDLKPPSFSDFRYMNYTRVIPPAGWQRAGCATRNPASGGPAQPCLEVVEVVVGEVVEDPPRCREVVCQVQQLLGA